MLYILKQIVKNFFKLFPGLTSPPPQAKLVEPPAPASGYPARERAIHYYRSNKSHKTYVLLLLFTLRSPLHALRCLNYSRAHVAPSTGKVSPTSGDCHGGILLKDVQNYMK